MLFVLLWGSIVAAQEGARVPCDSPDAAALRPDQGKCFEQVEGARELIDRTLTVQFPQEATQRFGYDQLQQYVLDPNVQAQAYYHDALSFFKIAQLKREYEGIKTFVYRAPEELPDNAFALVYDKERDVLDVLFVDRGKAPNEYTLLYDGKELSKEFVRQGDMVRASLPLPLLQEQLKQYWKDTQDPVWFLLPLFEVQEHDAKSGQGETYRPREISYVPKPNVLSVGAQDLVKSVRLVYQRGSAQPFIVFFEQNKEFAEQEFLVEAVLNDKVVSSERVLLSAGRMTNFIVKEPANFKGELEPFEQSLAGMEFRIYRGITPVATYLPDELRFLYARVQQRDREEVSLDCFACQKYGDCTKQRCESLGKGLCEFKEAKIFDAFKADSVGEGLKKGWNSASTVPLAVLSKFDPFSDTTYTQTYDALKFGYCVPKERPKLGDCSLCGKTGLCDEIFCPALGENCIFDQVEKLCKDVGVKVFGENVKGLTVAKCKQVDPEKDKLAWEVVLDRASVVKIRDEIKKLGYDEMIKKVTTDKTTRAIIAGMIAAESGANKKAVSKYGCKGILQFCGKTAWVTKPAPSPLKTRLCDCTLADKECFGRDETDYSVFCTDEDKREDPELSIQKTYELLQDNIKTLRNDRRCRDLISDDNPFLLDYAIAMHNTGEPNVCGAMVKAKEAYGEKAKDLDWKEVLAKLEEYHQKPSAAAETQCYVPKVLYYAAEFGKELFDLDTGDFRAVSAKDIPHESQPRTVLQSHVFTYRSAFVDVRLKYDQSAGGWLWKDLGVGSQETWKVIAYTDLTIGTFDHVRVEEKKKFLEKMKVATTYAQGVVILLAHPGELQIGPEAGPIEADHYFVYTDFTDKKKMEKIFEFGILEAVPESEATSQTARTITEQEIRDAVARAVGSRNVVKTDELVLSEIGVGDIVSVRFESPSWKVTQLTGRDNRAWVQRLATELRGRAFDGGFIRVLLLLNENVNFHIEGQDLKYNIGNLIREGKLRSFVDEVIFVDGTKSAPDPVVTGSYLFVLREEQGKELRLEYKDGFWTALLGREAYPWGATLTTKIESAGVDYRKGAIAIFDALDASPQVTLMVKKQDTGAIVITANTKTGYDRADVYSRGIKDTQ